MTSKTRKPGRPRSTDAGDAIIDATLALVEEEGLAAVTIDAIVARAGVSKTTLYRRWDSKESLVLDALVAKVERIKFEETGDIRADLLGILGRFDHFVTSNRAGSVFPWVMGEVSRGSELGMRYAKEVILPRRAMIADLIAHAIARGELRGDLDITAAVDMLLGPVILRKIMGEYHPGGGEWNEHLADSLLDGWRSGQ